MVEERKRNKNFLPSFIREGHEEVRTKNNPK